MNDFLPDRITAAIILVGAASMLGGHALGWYRRGVAETKASWKRRYGNRRP